MYRFRNRILFLIAGLILLNASHLFAQNLLVNGGFEEENICTEYQVNCAPEGWVCNVDGFENYFKDPRRAHQGTHCMAIVAGFSFKNFQRSYIRSKLVCGLRKGHQYRLSFYLKSPYPILDSIGVLFTSFDFLFGQTRLQHLVPSIFVRPEAGKFKTDSSWQKVSMVYTARGDEAFVTIANFSRHDINGPTSSNTERRFFVFVDEVSLLPVDRRESICEGWQRNRDDIYAQNDRHEIMRQEIRQNKNNPPTVLVRPFTSLVIMDTLVVPDVLFATAKSELRREGFSMLDSICRNLASKRIDSVVVEGHTDNTGTPQLNEQLALDRAWSVEDAIRSRLALPVGAVVTRGWADRRPVADNLSATGRQLNRRVEIIVYTRE